MNWKNLIKGVLPAKSKHAVAKQEKELNEHYDIEPIDNTGAVYRVIVGQRSNGKTYKVCRHILEGYLEKNRRGAYIRRYDESIQPRNIQSLFAPHIDYIVAYCMGHDLPWNGYYYRGREFHLCEYDEEGKIVSRDETAFCITAAINTAESTKGQDRGIVHIICFDEFMTRTGYLQNEFVLFMNLLSTLIRDRDSAVIYMLANTVNKYCPYFGEMGLKNIEQLPKGEIAVYTYGDSDLTVAVEYCDAVKATKKAASKYFAFDNPQLKMITSGEWEFQIYPRAPYKIFKEDILMTFYIQFGENLLACDLVHPADKQHCDDVFIFVHHQTKDLEIGPNAICFVEKFSSCLMHTQSISCGTTEAHRIIYGLIRRKAVCFADNTVGEIYRNWLINTQGLRLY